MDEYQVFLNGKLIDIVFYQKGMTIEEVVQGLVDHDHYPANVRVKRVTEGK